MINAAPELDYRTMGNLFKGGVASGSWLCFDECNRLIPEVLAVAAVQFKAVCEALKSPKFGLIRRFFFSDPT